MAFESPMVTADAIEAIEFPHLANKYSVQGVPRTVINDKIPIEGAAPEMMVVEAIKKALAE
jgi:predicted DsbA family dithiol-disulfide isomerase